MISKIFFSYFGLKLCDLGLWIIGLHRGLGEALTEEDRQMRRALEEYRRDFVKRGQT